MNKKESWKHYWEKGDIWDIDSPVDECEPTCSQGNHYDSEGIKFAAYHGFSAGFDAALSTEVREAIRKIVEVVGYYAPVESWDNYLAEDDGGKSARSCFKEIELLEELTKE